MRSRTAGSAATPTWSTSCRAPSRPSGRRTPGGCWSSGMNRCAPCTTPRGSRCSRTCRRTRCPWDGRTRPSAYAGSWRSARTTRRSGRCSTCGSRTPPSGCWCTCPSICSSPTSPGCSNCWASWSSCVRSRTGRSCPSPSPSVITCSRNGGCATAPAGPGTGRTGSTGSTRCRPRPNSRFWPRSRAARCGSAGWPTG